MPKIVILIYFDYASTLCYIAWRIVTRSRTSWASRRCGRACRSRRAIFAPSPDACWASGAAECAVRRGGDGIRVAPPSMDRFAFALQGSELARDAGRFRGVS